MTDWRPLYRLADRQHRVIARSQIGDLGLSEHTVRQRAAREGWASPYPGVWVLPGGRPDHRTVASAALVRAGAAASLSRHWAGWLHGFIEVPPSRVELVLPASARAPRDERLDVARSRTLEPGDITTVDDLRVTTPRRTFLDLAAVCARPRLRDLLVTAEQRGLVTVTEVTQRLVGIGPITGRGQLLGACFDLAPERVDSVFELEVRRRLRAAALEPHTEPMLVPCGPDHRVQVDIPFPDLRVGIECDGFAYHSAPADLDRDGRRHNLLSLEGWLVLRVTWRRLERDWDGFLAEVRRAIDDRS